MSHEELLDEAGAAPGVRADASRAPTGATTSVTDAVLDLAALDDDPAAEDDAARGRRRRWATAALVLALAATAVAGGGHEVARQRDRRALAATSITVDRVLVDVRSLLYARLAGSPPTTRVPVRLWVSNHGSRPVRVLAVQVGGVPVEPEAPVDVAAGATVALRGMARADCTGGRAGAAPGLTVLPEGRGAARLAGSRGERVTVALRGWPQVDVRLPSGAACDAFRWSAPPTAI